MNNKQNLVVNGLLNLPDAEAEEAIREFRRIKADPEETVKFSREIKMQTGPYMASGGCLCCGK